jgi:hypothetical protein
VRCTSTQRGELRDLANIFRADILDVSPNTVTIEILGKEDKMKALTDLLEPYGKRGAGMGWTGCNRAGQQCMYAWSKRKAWWGVEGRDGRIASRALQDLGPEICMQALWREAF